MRPIKVNTPQRAKLSKLEECGVSHARIGKHDIYHGTQTAQRLHVAVTKVRSSHADDADHFKYFCALVSQKVSQPIGTGVFQLAGPAEAMNGAVHAVLT